MQPSQDPNRGINLYYKICMENLVIRQGNQCRPGSDKEFIWFCHVCVPVLLISHPHLFCKENMAVRRINQCRPRSDENICPSRSTLNVYLNSLRPDLGHFIEKNKK